MEKPRDGNGHKTLSKHKTVMAIPIYANRKETIDREKDALMSKRVA